MLPLLHAQLVLLMEVALHVLLLPHVIIVLQDFSKTELPLPLVLVVMLVVLLLVMFLEMHHHAK
jgi:hypothetical protein